jgi:hypothetical protein
MSLPDRDTRLATRDTHPGDVARLQGPARPRSGVASGGYLTGEPRRRRPRAGVPRTRFLRVLCTRKI